LQDETSRGGIVDGSDLPVVLISRRRASLKNRDRLVYEGDISDCGSTPPPTIGLAAQSLHNCIDNVIHCRNFSFARTVTIMDISNTGNKPAMLN
jgi:hypothetical protein